MKKKTGERFAKTPVSCLQETVLRQLVKIAGLHEMMIWRSRNNAWHVSVTVTQRSQVIYLSTRRACLGPSHGSRRRWLRDSGSGPPVRSRSSSGKRRPRLLCAQRDRTSPTRTTFQRVICRPHINLCGHIQRGEIHPVRGVQCAGCGDNSTERTKSWRRMRIPAFWRRVALRAARGRGP